MRRKKRIEILSLVEATIEESFPELIARSKVADAVKVDAELRELRRIIISLHADLTRLQREMVTALGMAANGGGTPADAATDSTEGRPSQADVLRDLTYLACRVRMLEEEISKKDGGAA